MKRYAPFSTFEISIILYYMFECIVVHIGRYVKKKGSCDTFFIKGIVLVENGKIV